MIDCRCAPGKRRIAAGATLAVALLPKFGCPLCAPLLAAILGMLGLSLQAVGWLLTAFAAGLVGVALLLLVRDRGNRAPAILALVAGIVMLAYRVADLPDSVRYIGTAAFAAALIWRACNRMRFQHIPETSFTVEGS